MIHGSSPKFNSNPLDVLEWDAFDYLLPALQEAGPGSFLATDPSTIAALRELGATMSADPAQLGGADSEIPAPYTYLGQFIDHDITQTAAVGTINPDAVIGDPAFTPFSASEARAAVRNRRTSGFDLDSVYGLHPASGEEELAVPFFGDKFELGVVTLVGNGPPGKASDNDLPRVALTSATFPRRARIGDHRNDENVVVAQLHLAFLKFHNAVVDDGFNYDDARRLVTHHYQWLVLTDFLPRICDPRTVAAVLQHGNRLYRPASGENFMPFEYAVAAYRFGHSMVRSSYDFNLNFLKQGGVQAPGTLDLLFRFTGLSGDMFGSPTLPENWIIEWERMFADRAMQIDPTLTTFLARLPGQPAPVNIMQHLAIRNLLKGYLFHLPTGQALAESLLVPSDRMSAADLEAACRPKSPTEAESQWEALKRHGFDTRTPLWFYILAEAKAKGGGNHLGPLGSLIVAETVIGLMRANAESILNKPFIPTLGATPGKFDLQDLLIKAGVLGARV